MTTTGAASIYGQLFRSFGLRENPFHVSPDPRFLFSGPAYEAALAELMFGIEAHSGLVVFSGEAGTGKTTLVRHFLQWLKDRQFSSSYIFHTHLDPAELFEFILRDFGVPIESTKKTDLIATMHRWLQSRQAEGDSPVVIIDEAQALSLRTLSELSLLLNLENTRGKLLQIVLVGQPELEEKLRRPELRAVRQRVMVRCRLPLLTLEETSEYIKSRLRGAGAIEAQTFPLETVQTIYSYARGIPRVVNLLCEHALIGAYADRRTFVSPGHVRKVAADFDLSGEPFSSGQFDLPVTMFSTPLPEALPSELEEIQAFPVSAALPPSKANLAMEFLAQEPAAPEMPVPQPEPVVQALAISEQLPSPAVSLVSEPVETPEISVVPQIPESPDTPYHPWMKRRSDNAFYRYWRDVGQSFTRDMRAFYHSTAPQVATIAGRIPSSSTEFRRSFLQPLRDWLAKPINHNAARSPSDTHQSRSQKTPR